MGIVLIAVALPEDQALALGQDGAALEQRLFGMPVTKPRPRTWLDRLLGRHPVDLDHLPPADVESFLDLDKHWEIAHALLTGPDRRPMLPAATLVEGGAALGTTEVGYGVPRLLRPAEVGAFAQHLQTLDPEAIAQRLDLRGFIQAGLYGAEAWADDPNAVAEAQSLIEEVREWFIAAAADRMAVILCFA